MRDPYHSARVRFKVARDRFCEARLQRAVDSCNRSRRIDLRMPMNARLQRQRHWLFADLAGLAACPDCGEPVADELTAAAGILHTMLKWKCQDERQALMLWKLSRD